MGQVGELQLKFPSCWIRTLDRFFRPVRVRADRPVHPGHRRPLEEDLDRAEVRPVPPGRGPDLLDPVERDPPRSRRVSSQGLRDAEER